MFTKIFILLFLLPLIGGFGLVFGGFINFEPKITLLESSSNNIITSSSKLDSIILVFKSSLDIADSEVATSCDSSTQFLGSAKDIYIFQFKMLSDTCENPFFHLEFGGEKYESSEFRIKVDNREKIFSLLIDYDNATLNNARNIIIQKINNYSHKKEHTKNMGENYFEALKRSRKHEELVYKERIMTQIINRRAYKYSVPVKGYQIATGHNVIPNASRDYRSGYTDGIHHGWDIMAPLGTPVSAIDDGIIIRVVDNFVYEDIANIKKGKNISHSQKLRNLDILRGNQIWLKTTKGDVIFYSHLDEIYDTVKEGIIVPVGHDLGTIGVTGVPDRNYKNYHLHFPIQKNPYTLEKAGKYSLEDYMNWDWYLKGLPPTEVIAGQDDVFVKEIIHNHEEE